MSEFTFKEVKNNLDPEDSLRISRSGGRIHSFITVFKFTDKDTNQIISYCPAFDISGYGENEDKALEMLKFSISEYFNYLISTLSNKQMEAELRQLGWKQSTFRHKNYSKAYVDINGELQNLNAVDNKVEIMTLQTA